MTTRKTSTAAEADIVAALPIDGITGHWVRLGGETNDVWHSSDHKYVIRIARDDLAALGDPVRTVQAARMLVDAQVPAVRLVDGLRQPFSVAGRAATLWHYVSNERPASLLEVAQSIASLRQVPSTAAITLPKRDLVPAVRARLAHLRGVQPARADYWTLLDRWCERVAGSDDPVPHRLVHGDMRASNVLTCCGVSVLADLDSVSIASPLFDLWRFEVDHLVGRTSTADFIRIYDIVEVEPAGRWLPDFVRLVQLGFTTLAEVRVRSATRPMWVAQCEQFERWWRSGSMLERLPGWDETWT